MLFIPMLSFGVYGFIANSLILYLKYKQHIKRRQTIQRPFNRSLTEYFINSLALSDVLCSAISFPSFVSEMFIDFVHYDWICKLNRFFGITFPVITILNLLTIGLERYFAIFHPFSFLSQRKAKKMVVGAWILGSLITVIPLPAYNLVRFDIDDNTYTLICKYDNSLPLYRRLFISFIAIVYIIPSCILIFVNLRILRYMRRSRRRVVPREGNQNSNPSVTRRFKATQMFISLIFAFIVPYLLFMFYSGVMMALELKLSFTTDYVARVVSAMLVYTNGAVSATIFFHKEKDLKKMLMSMLHDLFIAEDQSQGNSVAVSTPQQSYKSC